MRSTVTRVFLAAALILLLFGALRLATPSRGSRGEADTMCVASKIGLPCRPD
jgi:hypothetical protein